MKFVTFNWKQIYSTNSENFKFNNELKSWWRKAINTKTFTKQIEIPPQSQMDCTCICNFENQPIMNIVLSKIEEKMPKISKIASRTIGKCIILRSVYALVKLSEG